MEHLRDFLETCCIRNPKGRVSSPFLYAKFKEFLTENYPTSDLSFTSNNFTIKVKKVIDEANIPGDSSKPMEYKRDSKGTALVGLSLNENYEQEVEEYKEQIRTKANAYNSMHYAKKSVEIKEKKKRVYAITSFKHEFLTKMGKDPLNPDTSKQYDRTARLCLVKKVFNPDNTINWEETIRLTLEAVNTYQKNSRMGFKEVSPKVKFSVENSLEKIEIASNNSEINVSLSEDKKAESPTVIIDKKAPFQPPMLIRKPTLRICTSYEDSVPQSISERYTQPEDYVVRSFAPIEKEMTLEEFDLYRYENYIKPKKKFDDMENYKDVAFTSYKSKERKRIHLLDEELGNKWFDFIMETGYEEYNDVLIERDKKLDMTKYDTFEKIRQKTDYSTLTAEIAN